MDHDHELGAAGALRHTTTVHDRRQRQRRQELVLLHRVSRATLGHLTREQRFDLGLQPGVQPHPRDRIEPTVQMPHAITIGPPTHPHRRLLPLERTHPVIRAQPPRLALQPRPELAHRLHPSRRDHAISAGQQPVTLRTLQTLGHLRDRIDVRRRRRPSIQRTRQRWRRPQRDRPLHHPTRLSLRATPRTSNRLLRERRHTRQPTSQLRLRSRQPRTHLTHRPQPRLQRHTISPTRTSPTRTSRTLRTGPTRTSGTRTSGTSRSRTRSSRTRSSRSPHRGDRPHPLTHRRDVHTNNCTQGV